MAPAKWLACLSDNGYNYSDIYQYETNAGNPDIPTINNVFLNDITNNQAPQPNDVEISGDIEMVLAMAPGIKALNVYEGDPGADGSGNTIFDEMAEPEQGEPLPHQINCSWVFSPDSASINNFVRFAIQGQSFFLALGDGGAFRRSQEMLPVMKMPSQTLPKWVERS